MIGDMNMKSKEQIINDLIKIEMPSEDYNLIEIQCFLSLKKLLIMYHNRQITPEKATETKKIILAKYESDKKQFEFEENMWKEYIENINKTEDLKTKLRKQLSSNTEINEVLNTCIELIQLFTKEEFI